MADDPGSGPVQHSISNSVPLAGSSKIVTQITALQRLNPSMEATPRRLH